MKETEQGLYVQGRLDLQDSEMAREAWRSMKNGTMSLSFGYIVDKSRKAKDGITDLLAIDLFEVSIVPAPANADTRVLSLKALTEQDVFPRDELQAAIDGDLKTVWTASYVNDLPDGAFLLVEDGGTKDDEGKTTPRSLRHFPYKDAGGVVDLPHLRNALARIPQSDLPQDVKDRLTARAQAILDEQKSVEATTPEPTPVPVVDPLKKQALAMALEARGDGLQPPRHQPAQDPPKPQPELDPDDLRKRSRALMVHVLTGIEPTE